MACSHHIVNYFALLESVAVGVTEMKRLGSEVSPTLTSAVYNTVQELEAARAAMHGCPDCLRQYQGLKP
jgi:hypothetical protein